MRALGSEMQIVSQEIMEQKALYSWKLFGDSAGEFVALIIGHRWFELTNVAGAHDEFEVLHDEVALTLEIAAGMGLGGADIKLWHSHIRTVEPSQYDVDVLPQWCIAGMIYHVPTGETTAYRHNFQFTLGEYAAHASRQGGV